MYQLDHSWMNVESYKLQHNLVQTSGQKIPRRSDIEVSNRLIMDAKNELSETDTERERACGRGTCVSVCLNLRACEQVHGSISAYVPAAASCRRV